MDEQQTSQVETAEDRYLNQYDDDDIKRVMSCDDAAGIKFLRVFLDSGNSKDQLPETFEGLRVEYWTHEETRERQHEIWEEIGQVIKQFEQEYKPYILYLNISGSPSDSKLYCILRVTVCGSTFDRWKIYVGVELANGSNRENFPKEFGGYKVRYKVQDKAKEQQHKDILSRFTEIYLPRELDRPLEEWYTTGPLPQRDIHGCGLANEEWEETTDPHITVHLRTGEATELLPKTFEGLQVKPIVVGNVVPAAA